MLILLQTIRQQRVMKSGFSLAVGELTPGLCLNKGRTHTNLTPSLFSDWEFSPPVCMCSITFFLIVEADLGAGVGWAQGLHCVRIYVKNCRNQERENRGQIVFNQASFCQEETTLGWA